MQKADSIGGPLWEHFTRRSYFAMEDEVDPGAGKAAIWSIGSSSENSEASPWLACTQIPWNASCTSGCSARIDVITSITCLRADGGSRNWSACAGLGM